MQRTRLWGSALQHDRPTIGAAAPNAVATDPCACAATELGELRGVLRGHQRYPDRALHDDPVDSRQADLAVIRIPAEGTRIGSLFVNPGWARRASAVDAVAGMGAALPADPITNISTSSASTRAASAMSTPAVAVPHRRRVRRVAARADGRLQPGRRRAHRSALPSSSSSAASQSMGTDVPGHRRNRVGRQDMDTVRAAIGDDQINYLGFSYGTEMGTTYVEPVRRTRARDGARRRHRPERRTRREACPSDGRDIPERVQRLRRRLRADRLTVRWDRIRRRRSTATTTCRSAREQAGTQTRIRAD